MNWFGRLMLVVYALCAGWLYLVWQFTGGRLDNFSVYGLAPVSVIFIARFVATGRVP